jgi:hypothetical protein
MFSVSVPPELAIDATLSAVLLMIDNTEVSELKVIEYRGRKV